jgi:DNA-binding beta-propeller fold protein YncE
LLTGLLLTLSWTFCQADVYYSHDTRVQISPLKGAVNTQPIYMPTYLYVSDMDGDQILRFDAHTGAFIDYFVQEPAGRLMPNHVAFGPDGDMYVSSHYQNGQIVRYDGENGLYKGLFFDDTKYLDKPGTLIFRGNKLWALSNELQQVVEIDANNGSVLGRWGSNMLLSPHDMAIDFWGNMLITTENAPKDGLRLVQIWSTRTDSFEGSVGEELFGVGTAITYGPDGNFYVADWRKHQILRFDGATYSYDRPFVSFITRPTEIAFGPKGNLWVISNNSVIRFDGKTGERIDTIIPAGSHGMIKPVSLTFHTPGLLVRPIWNYWPEEESEELVE